MTELTGLIVQKNQDQHIAYAAVLVPGEPDSDFMSGEKILDAAKIEQVAHKWMEGYRNVDVQHSLVNVATPVESYILPMEMTVPQASGKSITLPKGTWILASKVQDESTWQAVKSGKLTGYSVMGVSRKELNRIQATAGKSASIPEAAFKKTLLADLGEDWVGTHVSIVDEPAVPKAKFFALKMKAPEDPGSAEVTANPVERAVKEGRRFSQRTLDILRAAHEALTHLMGEAEAEVVTRELSKAASLEPAMTGATPTAKGMTFELTVGGKTMTNDAENTTDKAPVTGDTAAKSTDGTAVKMDAGDTQYLLKAAINQELQPIVAGLKADMEARIAAAIKEHTEAAQKNAEGEQADAAQKSAEQAEDVAALKEKIAAQDAEIAALKAQAETFGTQVSEAVSKSIEDRFGKRGSSNALKGQDATPGAGATPSTADKNKTAGNIPGRDAMGRSLKAN